MEEVTVARPYLTDVGIDRVLAAARDRAQQHQIAITVTIVDHTTKARGLWRAEQADILTVDLASGKAQLTAANGMPTRRWRELVTADRFLGLTLPIALDRALGGAVFFGGGYPIRVEGITIGGIGVSGGTESQDDEVARAALEALPYAEQFPAGS